MGNRGRNLRGLSWVAVIFLAACASNPPEPTEGEQALERINNQTVTWEACDPSIFTFVPPEALTALGERLECATLSTALDWKAPERDTINLGVLRVKAADSAARKGAIFLNPGGPGGDGLELGALFGFLFASAGQAGLPAAEQLTQISAQYDILGFSPRGTGGSLRLYCGLNAFPPPANFYTDRSPANVEAQLAEARALAKACQNNPLNKYVDTEQTVQDMDLIRRLLGDEKLNYLGYSYGTWLGSWYAKRFPENAGNIVLDANMEFSTTFEQNEINFVEGFERAFRDVVGAFAARNNALFELGETKEAVYEVYADLPQDLKQPLLFGSLSLINNLYSSALVPDITISLVAAEGVSTVLESFGEEVTFENFDAFATQLSTFTYAEDENLNSAAQEAALVLADDYLFYLEYLANPLSGGIDLGPGTAVYYAIACNDSPWNKDPAFWVQQGNEANETAPLLGGNLTGTPCPYWHDPTTEVPAVPSTLPPVLMVQNGFDAATTSEGALRAFDSLPSAKLVYIENEMSHTTFPYSAPCVDTVVANYLLNGTLPGARVTNCEAKPLPGEAEVFPPGGVPQPAASAPSLSAMFKPSGSTPLYDLIHERLRENAADFFGHAAHHLTER